MPVDVDLEEVITDSVADATLPAEPVEDTPSEPEKDAPEAPSEPTEAVPEGGVKVKETPEPEKIAEPAPKDDFEKKFGIPAQGPTGRENRIPYSRVKKITEKAVADAKKEWESTSTPKLQEYETKVKEYEGQFAQVKAFEQVMTNEPEKFLRMLATLPAYTEFFTAVEQAFSNYNPQANDKPVSQEPPTDDMPQPDQALSDGSYVYSMDGLRKLLAWQAKQVEDRVTQQVTERYKPIESEWEAHQRVQSVIPVVQQQIADARTWPLFTENENEIVQVLKANPKVSLEGAYRHVVMPKLVADRNKMRDEVLKEVSQAPKATSVATKPAKAVESSGPKSLEEIIADQIKTLK